jgi:hypothetical protein
MQAQGDLADPDGTCLVGIAFGVIAFAARLAWLTGSPVRVCPTHSAVVAIENEAARIPRTSAGANRHVSPPDDRAGEDHF